MITLSRGVIDSAQKVVIYGPEGIGKSTLAARFPNPVFIDVEGSTKRLGVMRLQPRAMSLPMLYEQIRYVIAHPGDFDTMVIDTMDWAEKLIIKSVVSAAGMKGIEDYGYGKGYVYVEEEAGRLLNLCDEVIDKGINVVLTAHAIMRKFEQPDELGAYDRWELKLSKKVAPLVKEWADMLLFATYKTIVISTGGTGPDKGKNKAQGGKRVMYTTHHPCWDAKNRVGLPECIPLDYAAIAPYITSTATVATVPASAPVDDEIPPPEDPPVRVERQAPPPPPAANDNGIPQALQQLMDAAGLTAADIEAAVSHKGYYPAGTPIKNYDPKFVQGVLIAAWQQVSALALKIKAEKIGE